MNVFITGLQLILVILKVTGYIDVSWFIVFLPSILLLVILGICLVICTIHAYKENQRIKKEVWQSLRDGFRKDRRNDEESS